MTDTAPIEIAGGVGAEDHSAPATLRWREFGYPGDLDVDFRRRDRPATVTEILARCLAGPSPTDAADAADTAWRLSLAARIGGLAAVVARTFAAETIAAGLPCAECARPFELELPLRDIIELARSAEQEPVIEATLADGQRLSLRRPTGADLRAWQARTFASRRQAEIHMLTSLLLPDHAGGLDPATVAGAAELLAERDPLVAFQADCTCPSCGHRADYPVNIEALLLARLEHRRHALALEIHCLAGRYGWSEQQILAIPPARRAEYLQLIDRDAGLP